MIQKIAITTFVSALCIAVYGFTQTTVTLNSQIIPTELPPGWDTYSSNPSCETVIILDNVFPTIDGERVQTGDYIGAFYNDNGTLKCGGAVMYTDQSAFNITLYGDDSMTPERDGFHYNDSIYWKIYSYVYNAEYEAFVDYATGLYYSSNGHYSNGSIASVLNIASGDFRAFTYISAYNSCNNTDSIVTASCTAIGGSGSYSYSWASIPEMLSSPDQIVDFQTDTTIILDVTITDLESGYVTHGFTRHLIIEPPHISLTSDTTMCGYSSIHFYPTVTNQKKVKWTTTGDGFFNNTSNISPIYYPGNYDVNSGHVDITLIAYSLSPCYDTTYHNVSISFAKQPEVSINAPSSVCLDQFISLDATANYVSSIVWTTSGDGFFSSTTDLQTTYTPGPTDIINTHVVLSLTGYSLYPTCYSNIISSKNITFTQLPNIIANDNVSICYGDDCLLSAFADNYSEVFWTTSGDGIFNDIHSFSPIYTPGESDIFNSGCTLHFNAIAHAPCNDTVSFPIHVNITNSPPIEAGNDTLICLNSVCSLSAVSSNYQSITWSTTGHGTFSNQHSLTSTYIPDIQDIADSPITIYAIINGLPPCNLLSTDSLLLTVQPLPEIHLSDNQTVLIGSTISLSGVITGGSGDYGYLWEPAELVEDQFSLNTQTYPILNETIFTLSVTDNIYGCSSAASMVVYVEGQLLTISLTATNHSVCYGDSSQLLLTPIGGDTLNYSFSWSSTPDGFHSIEQSPFVTPYTTTNYKVTTTDGISIVEDSISIVVNTLPATNAGEDIIIYPGLSVELNGSVTGNSSYSYLWSPADLLDDPSVPNPTTVILFETTTFILEGTDLTTGCKSVDSMTVVVSGDPFSISTNVSADSICLMNSVTLGVTASGGTENYTYSWSSSPVGFFSNEQFPVVTPSESTNYYVTVSDGISTLSDSIFIFVFDLPITNAGEDQSIYPGLTVSLNGSVTGNSSYSYLWSPPELLDDPTISNPTVSSLLETTTFTLTGTDIINTCQSVDYITVTVSGDYFEIIIQSSTDTICAGSACDISVAANGGTGNYSYLWSSSTPGYYSNEPNIVVTPNITTTYYVVVSDGISSLEDSITINVVNHPIVDAGDNTTICENSLYITNAQTQYSQTVIWTTSGDGTFENQNELNTTYIPGIQDIADGSCILTISAHPLRPCLDTISDHISLSIQPLTVVDAGEDETICVGDVCSLSGSVSFSTTFQWSSTGDGSFIDEYSLSTDYQPGINDIINGHVSIVLSATSVAPCTSTITDTLNLYLVNIPFVSAGDTQNILIGSSTLLEGSVNGGSEDFSYQWSPDSLLTQSQSLITETVALFESTLFTLTATDNVYGCTNSSSMIVNVEGELLNVNIIADNDTICAGTSVNITALPIGGSSNNLYEWTSIPEGFTSSTQSITVAPDITTTYIVTVNDGISIVSNQITITVNELPTTDAGENQNIYPGIGTTLSGSVTGNPGTLSYLWSPASLLDNPTILNPTTVALYQSVIFTLTATDINTGCQSSDEVTVIVSGSAFEVEAVADPITICQGETSTLNAEVAGGTESYSFLWSSTPSGFSSELQSPTVSPDVTTTYHLTVSDGISTLNDEVTVTVNSLPTTNAGEDVEIYPGLSVTLNGSVTGNSSSYSFLWTPSEFFDNPSSPNPTTTPLYESITFTLTGTDINTGCQSSDEVTVTVAGSAFEVEAVADPITICQGETSTLNAEVAGGTESYSFLWSSTPSGFSSELQSPTVSPDVTTTYHLTVSDGISTLSDEVTVNVNSLPTTEAGNDFQIYPGLSVTLNGSVTGSSGPYTYLWTPSEFLDNPSSPNPTTTPLYESITFTLTGTDINTGCQSSDEVTVTVAGSAFEVEAVADPITICQGETSTLNAEVAGGTESYSFLWSSTPSGFSSELQSPTVSPDVTTTYHLTVSDGISTLSDEVTVTVNSLPTTNAGEDIDIYPGLSVTLNGSVTGSSGPYTYLWTPSEFLDNPSSPNPTTTPLYESITFTLTGTDINTGCQSSDEVTVIVSGSAFEVEAVADPITICQGETSTLNAEVAGGTESYSFLWSSTPSGFSSELQSPTVSPDVTTTYHLTVSDGISTLSDEVTVTVNSLPTTNAGEDIDIYPGLSVTLNGSVTGNSGSYSYLWTPSEFLDNPSSPNPTTTPLYESITFTLTGTDINTGCQSSDEVTVIVSGSAFEVEAVADPITICQGETSTLNAEVAGGTESYSFLWSSTPSGFSSELQSPTVSPNVTTTYHLTVSDGISTLSDEVTVTVNSLPTTNAGEDIDIYPGLSVTLNGSVTGSSGSYTYLWTPSEFLDNPSSPNPTTTPLYESITFTLTGTDINTGCQSSDEVTVTVAGSAFEVEAVADPITICQGETSTLNAEVAGGTESYSFLWSSTPSGFSSELQSPTVSPNVTTTYHLTVSDGISTLSDEVTVTVNSLPTTNAGEDIDIYPGLSVTLNGSVTGSSGSYTYLWTPSELLDNPSSPNPTTTTLYESITFTLTGTDINTGCQSSDEVTVIVSGSAFEVEAVADPITICQGETSTLNAEVAGGTESYSFLWSSTPSGFSSELQSPTVSPNVTTTYHLTVSDGISTLSDEVTVTVNSLPITNAGEDIDIYPGLSVTLNGSVTGSSGSYTYLWTPSELLDNPSSPNPTTIPLFESTTFTLVGTNIASGCQSVDNMTITVSGEAFTIDIEASSTEICAGDYCLLNVIASGGSGLYTYTWSSLPAGFTSIIPTPIVSPYVTTTYIVVVSDGISTLTEEITINVNDKPIVNAGEDRFIYPGLSIELDGSVSGDSDSFSYLWTPEEYFVNPTELHPTTIPLMETVMFTLVATDLITGCEDSDNTTIFVSGTAFEISVNAEPDELCSGGSSTLYVEAEGGNESYSFSWSSIPEGFSSNEQSLEVTPLVTTTYIATVTDGTSTLTDQITITVHANPVTFAGQDMAVYIGESVQLDGLVTGGESGQFIYSWSPAELLNNPNIPNPITVPLTESVVFTLVGSDINTGCLSYDDVSIEVSGSTLSVDISATSTSMCSGDSITLSANASGGIGDYFYEWSSIPAGFYSVEQSPKISPSSSTRYYVTVTDDYSSVEDFIDITVWPPIHTTILLSQDTLVYGELLTLTAYSNIDVEYIWLPYYLTGNSITIDTNYYNLGNNTVYVVSTDSHGCYISNSVSFYTKEPDGIISVDDNIVVSPNPFSNNLTISLTIPDNFSIINISGQTIFKSSYKLSGDIHINTTLWKSGVYFIKTRNKIIKTIKL